MMRKANCKAKTKAGTPCRARAIEKGLCFFHAHPEKAAELGRDGGRKNRHRIPISSELAPCRLRSFEDVQLLLEETVNNVRQGPFDLRAANSIGFLAGRPLNMAALKSGSRSWKQSSPLTRETTLVRSNVRSPRRKPMINNKRIRNVELSLSPRQIVLLWLATVVKGTFADGGRAARSPRETIAIPF
jgi:hypothetical protein